ncbi:MAG: hypothetical protein EOO16_05615 [Chitinophagaceae bacterium]|nr:MAG: hypothetical protein EOO16_05615 [Chitinophagaceae bacterium]
MSTRFRRWLLSLGIFTVLLVGGVAWASNHYVEPILRERIGILIVQGSDSLYRYKLDNLEASLFAGHVEVDGLEVAVDSARYKLLAAEGRLPAITFNVSMPHGHLRGIGLWSLLVGRKVHIDELFTEDARIELWRNSREARRSAPPPPLWKAIRPGLSEIVLNRLRLDGVRFAYRYESDSSNLQLKFDTCTALIRDIRIDSLAATEPDRIGFCRYVNLHFYDLKFRSPDSTFKLKAKVIDYSSEERTLTIREFKLQPTLKDKESFYAAAGLQRQMTVIEFDRLDLKRFRMEDFFHDNAVRADSLVIDAPVIDLYTDKTYPPTLDGKTGSYPNQLLLKAGTEIDIKAMALRRAALTYTERAEKSGREGVVKLEGLNLLITNVTNMPSLIRRDSVCRMRAEGRILGSPIEADFGFDLSPTNPEGRFTVTGVVHGMRAPQLTAIAEPLAFVRLQRFDLQELRFSLRGDEYGAGGEVRMRYRNLFLELQKENEQTGLLQSKKFLTKILNKYTIRHDNPEAGVEQAALHVQQSRLMTQTFFGLIWKSVFSGMQTIMTNTGEPL